MSTRFGRLATLWALLLATAYVGLRIAEAVGNGPGDAEQHTIALFETAAPSVVTIFADLPPSGTQSRNGAGSGFLWDADGHVVTNYHVIEGAVRLRVRLDTGQSAAATVVGVAPDQDLAVLQLPATGAGLTPLPRGRSAGLKVGQTVYAIGNPFGLSRTLTKGIISALDRRLPTETSREIAGVIQTDAAINPGNSGGPLLDSSGRLIGVTTAILSGTGSFTGIGFAVPVDVVGRTIPALIRDGRMPRPGIGVLAAPEEVAGRHGVTGVIVAQVEPRSSAAAAGLAGFDRGSTQPRDVITEVDGRPVRSIAEFAGALERAGVGRQVQLTVQRDGRNRQVTVTVMDIAG